jgi:hypothetical protein
VLVASICLLTSLLALASSISFVQAMNSASERRSNAEDFIRSRLQAIKGTVENSGGLLSFARDLEPDPTVYNPVLTADMNDPTSFLNTFGFPIVANIPIHNNNYVATFQATEFRFDSSLAVVVVQKDVDHLRDLAYIKFTVDLLPADVKMRGNGQDGPLARHGEIYVAK